MTRKPQINFTRANPLIVRNVEVLEDCNGERLPTKPVMALCRCGESKSQPFCDGKHLKAGFRNELRPEGKLRNELRPEGKPDLDEDDEGQESNCPGHKGKEYKGEKITVYFDLSVCSHSAVCLRQLPTVFDTRKRPWINPDGAECQEIIKTIEACPSGALKYILPENQEESVKRETKIFVVKSGPYNVQGGIELCGDTCPPADPERYCLCRCGRSHNTPFCDGTHLRSWDEDLSDI